MQSLNLMISWLPDIWSTLYSYTSNRVSRFQSWTPSVHRESASSAWVAVPAIYASDTAHMLIEGEKGRDLTQCHDKSSYTNRKFRKAKSQYKNATKNFDNTTIANRHRTVSWRNDSYPTFMVKPANGIPTFPLTAKSCVIKRTHFLKG